MRLYVLDTDTISLLRDRQPRVEARFRAISPPDMTATTTITVHESVMGWHLYILNGRTPLEIEHGYRELARTVHGFAGIPILGYSVSAIARHEALKRLKLNIGKNDLRIAAIALEAGAVVVTATCGTFSASPASSARTGPSSPSARRPSSRRRPFAAPASRPPP